VISRQEHDRAKARAGDLFRRAGLALTPGERDRIEVVDFGLGEIEQSGLHVVGLLETPNIAVRLVALTPWQACPEHRHPALADHPGKEETLRCAWGEAYVHLPGAPTPEPLARPPEHRLAHYTSRREVVLRPGEQVTCVPQTWHWFQAGPEGAVLWLFCSRTTDAEDEFTDPAVDRMAPVVQGEHRPPPRPTDPAR
jgi:D-lyxose ketol-isomerase